MRLEATTLTKVWKTQCQFLKGQCRVTMIIPPGPGTQVAIRNTPTFSIKETYLLILIAVTVGAGIYLIYTNQLTATLFRDQKISGHHLHPFFHLTLGLLTPGISQMSSRT